MVRTFFGLVMLLIVASAAGAATPGVCVKGMRAVGTKVRCADFLANPVPTPIATAAPRPTVATDCSDGTFSYDQSARELRFGVPPKGRLYEVGRPYHLCATVPASPRPFFELKSVNHSNGVCNTYEARLVAPDGAIYVVDTGRQLNKSPNYQPGTWQLVLLLQDSDSCPNPTGLSMTLSGF